MFKHRLALLAVAALLWPSLTAAEVRFTGTNLSGAEFGKEFGLPGTDPQHYSYPRPIDADYFIGKGANVIRLPFLWERLQRTLGGAFDTTELGKLTAIVNHTTASGAYVVLDPHNYARYNDVVIGTGNVTNAHFANFWSRLASLYKNNPRVIFGLMNEPYNMPSTEHWVQSANAAIAAIRNTGATNLILVPGNAYTGAHSWTASHYGTPNSVAMLNIVDPANNYAFDVHQYLDTNYSGTTDVIVSPQVGAEKLNVFTQWARQHGRRGFLGEFAAANAKFGTGSTQIADEAITNMLNHMSNNSDVWLGWTWWSGGPRWNEYMFTLQPTNIGQPTQQDRPAMGVLGPRFVGPKTTLVRDDFTGSTLSTSTWTTVKTVGTATAGVDGAGNFSTDVNYANTWHRAFAVSNSTSFNPFVSPIRIVLDGISVSGTPDAGAHATGWVLLGRSTNNAVAGYFPSGADMAYGVSVFIRRANNGSYNLLVNEWSDAAAGGKRSETVYALSAAPTRLTLEVDGAARVATLMVAGAVFSATGQNAAAQTLSSDFTAQNMTVGGQVQSRIAFGAKNQGTVQTGSKFKAGLVHVVR